MSKKHFEAVARILNNYAIPPSDKTKDDRHAQQYDTVCAIAYSFAAIFQAENPRFDRARFLKACGITE